MKNGHIQTIIWLAPQDIEKIIEQLKNLQELAKAGAQLAKEQAGFLTPQEQEQLKQSEEYERIKREVENDEGLFMVGQPVAAKLRALIRIQKAKLDTMKPSYDAALSQKLKDKERKAQQKYGETLKRYFDEEIKPKWQELDIFLSAREEALGPQIVGEIKGLFHVEKGLIAPDKQLSKVMHGLRRIKAKVEYRQEQRAEKPADTEKKAEDNLVERKRQLEPYGRMDGEQLLEAFCDNAELREEFGGSRPELHASAFNELILFILRNYEHSPIHREDDLRYLRQVEDVELKMMIRQRREAREAKETSLAEVPISKLIKQGESHTLEFKETLECDTQREGKNKDVSLSSLKTIAGFLNAKDGTLLIGVDDSGKIKGIERDLNILKLGNKDKFELKIRNYLKDRFKPQPIGKVKISFEDFPEGTICRIDVEATKDIVHLDNKVYVREGNATQKLEGRDLTDWMQQRGK